MRQASSGGYHKRLQDEAQGNAFTAERGEQPEQYGVKSPDERDDNGSGHESLLAAARRGREDALGKALRAAFRRAILIG